MVETMSFIIRMKDKTKNIKKIVTNNDFFKTLMHTKNFLIANIFFLGIGVVATPIFTKLLSTEEYGIVNLYDSTFKILSLFFTLSIEVAIMRYYLEKNDDFQEFLGTSIFCILILNILNISILILLLPILNEIINLSYFLIIIGISYSFFLSFHKVYFAIIRVRLKSREYLLVNIISSSSTIFLGIILVLIMDHNRHIGRILGGFVIVLILGIYFIFRISLEIKKHIKKSHLTYLLNFSLPVFLQVLGVTILRNIDKLLVYSLINASTLGIYSVAVNIAILVIPIFGSLNNASEPKIIDLFNNHKFKEADILVNRVFSIFSCFILILVFFMDQIYYVLVDFKFHEGIILTLPLIFGYYFFIKGSFYQRYFIYLKKTYYIAFTSLFICIINIFLNIIFLQKYGIIAAAYISIFSFFLFYILNWILCKYIVKIHIHPSSIFWTKTFLLIIFIGIGNIISRIIVYQLLNIALKFILVFAFFLFLFRKDVKEIIRIS